MRARRCGAWGLVLLIIVVACGKGGAKKDPQARVGEVAAVAGPVTVTSAAQREPLAVTVGLAVTRDMVLKTGPAGSVTVRFANNYVWTLAENRERAIGSLRVVDLPAAAQVTSVGDELASGEADRTSAAGRHAELEAAETEATARATQQEKADEDRARAAAELERLQAEREAEARVRTPHDAHKKPPPRHCRPDDPLCGLDGDGPKSFTPPPGDSPPSGPTRDELARGLKALAPRVLKCAADQDVHGVISVQLTVGPSGHVTEATVVGEHAGTPVASCVQVALKGQRIAKPFSGAPIKVKFPYKLP